jgi:hypothetical protein
LILILRLLWHIGYGHVDLSRLTLTRDRQFHGLSDAGPLKNNGEIGHAVHRLPVRRGNDVGNRTACFCRGRPWQRSHNDDAVDVDARAGRNAGPRSQESADCVEDAGAADRVAKSTSFLRKGGRWSIQ